MRLTAIAARLGLCSLMAWTLSVARPAIAATTAQEPLDLRATEVAALFLAAPRDVDSLFAPSFLAVVPPARVKGIFQSLFGQCGEVTSWHVLSRFTLKETLQLTFKNGEQATVNLALEPEAPHRIAGLLIGAPTPSATNLRTLTGEFLRLPGKVSFTACRLGSRPETLAELNPDEPLALGSAFKLFVLGALIEDLDAKKRHWGDEVTLTSHFKSLPSGVLQTWPDGSPLTLHTLAALMVSKSDNTATDHLLMTLGRDHVERMMAPMGVAHPERDQPFLSTREMFLIKVAGSELASYLGKDLSGRRAYLRDVVDAQDVKAAEGFGASGAPMAIDQVEWFASSRDMVRAMDWLRHHTESGPGAQAREILAINPGVRFDPGVWQYAGFKGGSEPGVLTMTFLLQSRQGDWYAMSACWNDTAHEVDTAKLVGLMQKAGDLLQSAAH